MKILRLRQKCGKNSVFVVLVEGPYMYTICIIEFCNITTSVIIMAYFNDKKNLNF